MTRIKKELRVGSTHPLPIYNGFRTPLEVLENHLKLYEVGEIRFQWHHDVTQIAKAEFLSGEIRQGEDGEFTL